MERQQSVSYIWEVLKSREKKTPYEQVRVLVFVVSYLYEYHTRKVRTVLCTRTRTRTRTTTAVETPRTHETPPPLDDSILIILMGRRRLIPNCYSYLNENKARGGEQSSFANMDTAACNDSSGAKTSAPVSAKASDDGADAKGACAKKVEESVAISTCPAEPASKKRSNGAADNEGSDAATLERNKKPKLVRCGSSVADMLAKTQEVESLGRTTITDAEQQQRQARDNAAADSVSVTPMRNIVDVEGYKTEVYRVPHDTSGAHKQ